jgi:hypothetical protein
VLVCYAKFRFSWKDARRSRFDLGSNDRRVRLTSLLVGQLSFWYGQGSGGNGCEIVTETPAFDGLLKEVQGSRARAFRWFLGLRANFYFPKASSY